MSAPRDEAEHDHGRELDRELDREPDRDDPLGRATRALRGSSSSGV